MIKDYITRQTASFQIGILDTGIQHNHTDLAANINRALTHNWADETEVWTDHQGHGPLITGAVNAIVDNNVYDRATSTFRLRARPSLRFTVPVDLGPEQVRIRG